MNVPVAAVVAAALLFSVGSARAEGEPLAPTRAEASAPPGEAPAVPAQPSPSQIAGGATVLVLGVGALVGDAFAIASTVESGNCPSGVGGPADCGSAFFGELFLTIAGVSGVVGGSVLLAKGVRGAPPAAAAPTSVVIGPEGVRAVWQW